VAPKHNKERVMKTIWIALISVFIFGCSGTTPAPPQDTTTTTPDVQSDATQDASSDAVSPADQSDGQSSPDAAPTDISVQPDQSAADAAAGDAAAPDATATDVPVPDATVADAVVGDVAPPDTMSADAKPTDAGMPSDTGFPPGVDPEQAWFECESDDQCVVLEMGCCDHCNGGWLMTLNEIYAAEALATYKEKDCEGILCTKMACSQKEGVCVDGMCQTQVVTMPWMCPMMDEAQCESNIMCIAHYGAPSEEVCVGDYSNWMGVFAACTPVPLDPPACGDAETCAVNDQDGTKLTFSDTCVPPGWTAISNEECCD